MVIEDCWVDECCVFNTWSPVGFGLEHWAREGERLKAILDGRNPALERVTNG